MINSKIIKVISSLNDFYILKAKFDNFQFDVSAYFKGSFCNIKWFFKIFIPFLVTTMVHSSY